MDPLTYRAAGVDIRAGDEAVRRLTPHARSTTRPEVLGGIGAFAAFVRVPAGRLCQRAYDIFGLERPQQ